MFTLKALDRSTTFCVAPVRPKDTGLSSLLKSYLAQGEIIITEAAVTSPGDITLSPSAPLSRDSLYLPEIHAARAASELAAFLGPSALSSSLQSLARKKTYELHALTESGLLKQRPLNLTWSSGGVTVSITLPALILEQDGSKIALLDQSIADHYLMSLVALKGYLCFELITF